MRLYEANETEFNHNGFGFLSEATEAQVTEERNGAFELTMQYPSKGALFSELKHRRLIYCPAYPGGTPQPFRIYRITKPMGGLVTVYAEHISYDLSGVMLSRFSAGSAAEAFAKLPQYAVGNNPFTFFTDKSTQAVFQLTVPASIRSKLGGSEGSLLDVYGGEYVFDGFTVKLLNERGQNRGVSIRYGKNLTDLTQEENIQSVYTGVYPYWAKEDDYFELPEKTVNAEGDFGFTRLMPLDLSSEFEEKPSAEQLRAKAQEYMKSNKIGVPKVSLTVSFFPLEQSEEYKDLALLETVYLCDTVNVEFPALRVSATAKVVKTVYDVLRKRYRSIELGDAKSNIADTIVKQEQEIQKKPSYSALEDAIKNATNWITNGGGYIVAIKDEAGNWKEIVSLDVNNLEQAKKVWRWNNGGFGFSATGYNGPYRLAITQDGAIVADFITVGTLTANIIKAGILAAANGKSFWNLETGELNLNGVFTSLKGRMKAVLDGGSLSYYIDDALALDLDIGDDPLSKVLLRLNGDQTKCQLQANGVYLITKDGKILGRMGVSEDLGGKGLTGYLSISRDGEAGHGIELISNSAFTSIYVNGYPIVLTAGNGKPNIMCEGIQFETFKDKKVSVEYNATIGKNIFVLE